MKPTIADLLTKYHREVDKCAIDLLTKKILIEKIKQTTTVDEGVSVLEKYNSYNESISFLFLDENQMITTLKNNIEILKYFNISPPPPPEKIAHLFTTDQIDGLIPEDETFYFSLKNHKRSNEEEAKINPEKFKINCLSCKEDYIAKNNHEIFVCPLCGGPKDN